MSYPYPQLVSQLQFPHDVATYRTITEVKRYRNYPEYWSILPRYLYAHCPICGEVYQEVADSYTLRGWGYKGLSPNLFSTEDKGKNEIQQHCPHFLGVREFINFHGIEPHEIAYLSKDEGEVPFVDRHFFSHGRNTSVVLHALPICRIENNSFVPSYTVFLMTYFSEEPSEVIKQTYQAQSVWYEIDPEYYPTLVTNPIAAKQEAIDLAQWAVEGLLGWLDFETLSLQFGKDSQLPEIYRHIEGRRKPFIWRSSKQHG